MKYLLDTNIVIYSVKGQYPSLKERFMRTPAQAILIPSIVLGEIEYGARKCQYYDKTILKYRRFLDAFQFVPFSKEESRIYGVIRSNLEKEGKTIGNNDLLIAAIAMANHFTLVSHNVNEFACVKGLLLEDWTNSEKTSNK